jgi:iron complex outermembrane receptor protein
MFNIGDRTAGFAAGVEHRRYRGEFNPDPLRQTGESQDSQAFPVKASYDVDEVYSEFNFPILSSLELSAAIRYSDYSTFGSATTGKVGFRWQPIEDLVLRGTWSEGFRAPNLGELYGLTQFGATLTDPCGPTGAPVVDTSNGVSAGLEAACVGAGVPNGFEQANTQIITFTGGNPDLDAEESENYTVGAVYAPSWAKARAGRTSSISRSATTTTRWTARSRRPTSSRCSTSATRNRAAPVRLARPSPATSPATCSRRRTAWPTSARSKPMAPTSRSTG